MCATRGDSPRGPRGVLAKFVVLRKPEGLKAALGEALSVGSRKHLVCRRSRPLTWTYDPRLRSQSAH